MQRLFGVRKRSIVALMRKCAGLLLLLVAFFIVVALVNPIREIMWGDDWAYGLTVRHLLATGEYRLNDWAAANMPVQVCWAALLAQLFGYSFSVLRVSTLIMLLIGLLALYRLLRDFNLKDSQAAVLTLAVFSSPAVLFLGFTFQTDVHFLGWQVLALLLYSRALRKQNYGYMALASLAAFAAVGTRQFGAALVAGLAATWVFFEKQRLRKASLYLLGLALPLLMSLWQFSFGINRPTFSQKVRLAEQVSYMHDLPRLLGDFLWRPTVILQYLGLYLLPVLPVLLALAQMTWSAREPANVTARSSFRSSDLWLLGTWFIYLTFGVCFGYFYYLRHTLMPYLAWLLPNTQTSEFSVTRHAALTLLTCSFALILAWLLSRRYFDKRNWRLITNPEWFVVLSGLALFGLQLLYAQFYDVYLIQFLPFTVFALANMAAKWPRWCTATTTGLCLVSLCISSLWTRGSLAQAEASWQAAELAHSAGAVPRDVGGNMTWSCYYGAFDEWIVDIGGSNASDRYIGSNRMHFAFFDFLNRRFDHAKYLVTASAPTNADTTAQLLKRVEYRDSWLRPRSIYVVRRSTVE
jgi:Dolichyl-phosphate-mannose-protein mannosyltransferase